MGSLDLVKAAIRYMGEWNENTTYESLDFVQFTGDRCGYISLSPNTGVTPGTDSSVWAKSVNSGDGEGGYLIDTEIEYTASDISINNLSWDTLHIFPTMPSLSFSLSSVPNDSKEHQAEIIFSTPEDMSDFSLSVDAGLLWASDIDLTQHLAPLTEYKININSGSMISMYMVEEGTGDTRKMVVPTDVAIPVGAKYRVQFFTDVKPEIVECSSSNTSVLTFDNDGLATGVGVGTATATVLWAGLPRQITFHVGAELMDTSTIPVQERVIDEIAIINPPASLEIGDEYALYAVGISNALSPKYDIDYYNPIKFSTSDPQVAAVHFGTLIGVGTGTCTITATDLNENATASFQLTVVAAQVRPSATVQETYVPTIDNTGATDVTVAISDAIAYAEANSYKMVSFPYGTYLMNADNRPNNAAIELPSDMVIDFNGSEIHFAEGNTSVLGYKMFQITNKQNVWLVNTHIFAENYGRETALHKEGDMALQINGTSKNIHIENCSFNYSPGFNVGISYSRNHISSFTPNTKILGSVEAGGLDANGDPIAAPSGTWRMAVYVSINLVSGGWVVGNFQGNQRAYLKSRLYDICFYDNNKDFLFRKTNCYVYQRYEFPVGVNPKYCKIAFFQTEEPTQYDGDYHAFTMIVDRYAPKDVYFKNCLFRNNWSTGLSPQGGEHIVLEHCTFIDNGYSDPSSHIDWEDGRQNAQGHIVRYSDFISDQINGQTINGYCRNITIHDCSFKGGGFASGSESTMMRTYHNKFEGVTPDMKSKMDYVFAGNILDSTPSVIGGERTGKVIDADNMVFS